MTDEEQVSQALAELWDIVKCRCHEAYTGRRLHDPDCECDSTDAVRTVATAITTLRAQLAEAKAGELAWAETAKIHLKAEQAFLSWLRDAGEHLRDEGVTICDDGTDSGEVLAAKVAECVGLLKARADRAEQQVANLEAALAAQIEADAGIGKRAVEMLTIAARYVRETYPDGYTVYYDEAVRGGYCIADDCEGAAEAIRNQPRAALARVKGVV